MPKLTIYTRSWCPYCDRAMAVLQKAGISDFEEISIDGREGELRKEIMEKTGGKRYDVPQLFYGDHYLGDDDDLLRLHQSGKLAELAGGPSVGDEDP